MSLSLFAAGVMSEVGVRIFVPASVFLVYSNVFARDSDPHVRYTLKRSYEGSAYGVDIHSNSHGFRGREWTIDRERGSLRIALVGDSHAFGYGVAFAQTMAEVLAARLTTRLARPVEVLNFGVPGYNARQELAVLDSRVMRFVPDLVLLMPCNNDADPPLWVDDAGFQHAGEAGASTLSSIAWDHHQRTLARFHRRALGASRALLWLRIQWFRYSMERATAQQVAARDAIDANDWMIPVGAGPVDESLRESVYAPLASMIDLCRARGVAVAVLTLAAPVGWRATLNALAAAKDVPLIELLSLLEGTKSYPEMLRQWSLGWDPHLGPRAQDVWARGVEGFLVQRGMVR